MQRRDLLKGLGLAGLLGFSKEVKTAEVPKEIKEAAEPKLVIHNGIPDRFIGPTGIKIYTGSGTFISSKDEDGFARISVRISG